MKKVNSFLMFFKIIYSHKKYQINKSAWKNILRTNIIKLFKEEYLLYFKNNLEFFILFFISIATLPFLFYNTANILYLIVFLFIVFLFILSVIILVSNYLKTKIILNKRIKEDIKEWINFDIHMEIGPARQEVSIPNIFQSDFSSVKVRAGASSIHVVDDTKNPLVPKNSKCAVEIPKYLCKGKWSNIFIYFNTNKLNKNDVSSKQVKIKIQPSDIDYDNSVVYKIAKSKKISILIKPNKLIDINSHLPLNIIVTDKKGIELLTISTKVSIKDFAFAHISKPLFNRIISILSFILGSSCLILIMLEKMKIDMIFSLPVASLLLILSLAYLILNRNYNSIEKL
jgi:hypothetical protein